MELFISSLFYLIVSFGLGRLFHKFDKNLPVSLQAIVGLFLITILLFFLHIIGGLSLKVSAWLVAISSIIPWIELIAKEKKTLIHIFMHPIAWVLSFPLIIYILNPHFEYFPYKWDEYSHWLLMAKQFYYAEALVSESFHYKQTVSYTPGWTLLLSFPQFFFSNAFNATYCLAAPIILSWLTIVFIFESLLLSGWNVKVASLTVLTLVIFHILSPVIPRNTLIDAPLICLGVIFFCFINLINCQILKFNSSTVLLSLILTMIAFLYKKPLILLSLIFLLAIISFKGLKQKERFVWGGVVLLLVQIVAVIWNRNLAGYDEYWDLSKNTNFGKDIFGIYLNKLLQMVIAYINYLLSQPQKLLVLGFGFWSFIILGKASALYKGTVLSFIYFAIYFLSLAWLYISVYSNYESENLASFTRYLAVTHDVFLFQLFLNFSYFIFSKNKIIYEKLKWKKIEINQILVALAFIILFVNLRNISYREISLEKKISIIVEKIFSKEYLKGQKANLLLIDQDGVGGSWVRLNYFLTDTSMKLNQGLYFNSHYKFSFDKINDIWGYQIDENAFKSLLVTFNIIWLHKLDSKISSILLQHFGDECEFNLHQNPQVLLISNSHHECISLN